MGVANTRFNSDDLKGVYFFNRDTYITCLYNEQAEKVVLARRPRVYDAFILRY